MDWSKLGKPRSRFGKWLDKEGISQNEMSSMAGLPRETISRYANNEESTPNRKTSERIMDAVNEIDPERNTRDFWEW